VEELAGLTPTPYTVLIIRVKSDGSESLPAAFAPPWPMGCANAGAATDHRFDLVLESWCTECALLLHAGADLRQAIVTHTSLNSAR
jgi:hypothetical protein